MKLFYKSLLKTLPFPPLGGCCLPLIYMVISPEIKNKPEFQNLMTFCQENTDIAFEKKTQPLSRLYRGEQTRSFQGNGENHPFNNRLFFFFKHNF